MNLSELQRAVMTLPWDRTQLLNLNLNGMLSAQQFAGDQFNRLRPGH